MRRGDLEQLERTRGAVPDARGFRHGADARPAAGERRPRGRSAARRGLPRALDGALGEGPGVGRGARAQRHRRQLSLRVRRRPTRSCIEEERRLLYVAMTRAKQELHLLAPVRFYVTQQSRDRRPLRAWCAQPAS
ncbi:MAG: hypothetical protein MZV70_42905 [Desulfobacterales bacterium]|nr:hypothetical protein [Desulfobacterales bacterium]